MNKNNYEVNVSVNGKPMREYYHKDKFYIEARQNSEYSVKIKNHSHKKIMAVLSIDGIDVLKGKNAIDAESGYIINPYSSTEIKGYRIDDDNVATFKFDDGKKSYSTQVEQKFDKKKIEKVQKGEIAPSKNNGVIGVRIWEEKEPMVIPEWKSDSHKPYKGYFYGNYNITPLGSVSLSGYAGNNLFSYSGACCTTGSAIINFSSGGTIGSGAPSKRNRTIYQSNSVYVGKTNVNQFGELRSLSDIDIFDNSLNSPDSQCYAFSTQSSSISNYTPNFELGTTWGTQQEDKVIKVQFIKADTYIDLEIFYLKREELIKLGIDVENAKKVFVSGYPKAFEEEEYCKTPTNWRKQ